MIASNRMHPVRIRERLAAGEPITLVCAYEDEARCHDLKLSGSLTLRAFQEEQARRPTPEAEIVFY